MFLNNVYVFVLFVFLVTLRILNGAYLRCYGESIDEYDEVYLEQAEKLLKSFYYNNDFSNFMYTFGFTGKVNGNYTIKVLNALLKRKDRNVFVVNWGKEASSVTTLGSLGYIFSYIVSGLPNSVKVGLDLGRALERMSKKGFKLAKTHAMGHSLGAHLLGIAGRYLVDIGKPLKRHDRAWRYYVEAISSPTAFPAVSATDYDSWVAHSGQTKQTIYLGDLTNTKAQGNFYLSTNSKPEFGKGAEGLKPVVVRATNDNTTSLTKLLKTLR